jgi:hypothetical protein
MASMAATSKSVAKIVHRAGETAEFGAADRW